MNNKKADNLPPMPSVLTLLLSHQNPQQLQPILERWRSIAGTESLLLAYGGPIGLFPQIDFPNKVFIDDDRLRVPDQQRQFQSWRAVLRAGLAWLHSHPEIRHVYLTEYDHVPLVPDLFDRLASRAEAESADVLAYHLHRIDGTSFAHYLFHRNHERFHRHFDGVSKREDKQAIFSMLPTGSFWNRQAFEAVAAREEPIPVYVELYLPTIAHHLGYRLRELTDQNRFVRVSGNRVREMENARSTGAWTLHPVKDLAGSDSLLSRIAAARPKAIITFLVGAFGTNFVDASTGRPVGRALVFSWRGKIHVVGLDAAVRPIFLEQKRVRYWKQEIGFIRHPSPDYPSLPSI